MEKASFPFVKFIYSIIDKIYLKINREKATRVFYSWVIKMRNRIKDLRVDADLKQREIAEAIGITQRKYSYIETGVQQATDEILAALALYYNTSVDYILGLTDERAAYPRRKQLLF